MTRKNKSESKTVSALGLLSGGLDSMLAAELLRRQGVQVTAVIFTTPFFGSARGEAAARRLGIPCRVEDITVDHLVMVKAPKYGYGKNMNPCIDCHAMMFARAGDLMKQLDADFLFSGEVLGQRPMSQNIRALGLVEKTSGYEGLLLRPLSAKLLPGTEPENMGLVDREALLDIQGRSRKRQMELAGQWGIQEYPNPGGGCLLTDPGFSVRLRDLFDHMPDAGATDVERLKYGRHFRLPGGTRVVVGRHREDNEALELLAGPGDILLKHDGVPGPLTLLDPKAPSEEIEMAASIAARYGKDPNKNQPVSVRVLFPDGDENVLEVRPMGLVELEAYRVG
ncbi:MAG: hypothetical protein P1S46_08540 [bacterium]|nr:hypothetical protein [bacterium]MDT8394842.1 hypothetical protein [bacterium]